LKLSRRFRVIVTATFAGYTCATLGAGVVIGWLVT